MSMFFNRRELIEVVGKDIGKKRKFIEEGF